MKICKGQPRERGVSAEPLALHIGHIGMLAKGINYILARLPLWSSETLVSGFRSPRAFNVSCH